MTYWIGIPIRRIVSVVCALFCVLAQPSVYAAPEQFDLKLQAAIDLERQSLRMPALEAYDRLRKVFPQQYEAHSGYIRIKESMGQRDEVLNEYKSKLNENEGDAVLFTLLGSMTMKDLAVSLEYYETARNIEPTNLIAHSGYASTLIHGKFERGWDVELNTVIFGLENLIVDEYDSTGFVYQTIGYAYYRMGDLDRAISYAEKASEYTGRRLVALSSLGHYQLIKDQEQKGLETLDKASAINPHHLLPYRIRADYFSNIGRITDAIQNYKRAMAVHVDELPVYNNYAWLLITSKEPNYDPDLALTLATYAVNNSSRLVPDYLDTLAEVKYCRGDSKGATNLIDEAIKLGPASIKYFEGQKNRFSKPGACPQ